MRKKIFLTKLFDSHDFEIVTDELFIIINKGERERKEKRRKVHP